MAELIFEIYSEEIPAKMQLSAVKYLQENFSKKIKENNLFISKCEAFVTPRRLCLYADGLSLTQEDSVTERKGPRTDAPAAAIEGFMRSTGLSKEQLTVKADNKGNDFYFAIIRQKGRPTKEIIKDILQDILENFYWPKSMKWGDYDIKWVRPIRNIAAVFGGDVIDISFGHIKANNISYGHSIISKKEITITNFEPYKKELEANFVLLDNTKRKNKIKTELEILAKDNALEIIDDETLFDEVTGLVEWPTVLMGSIDKAFMSLPEEVLITSIRTHQKYFCLTDNKGKLSSYFMFVANVDAEKDNLNIISGNEKVLKARLSDAVFFYRVDKEKGLANFSYKLDSIIYHKNFGSIKQKVKHTEKLCSFIADELNFSKANKDKLATAAELSKCDLATEMVGEFPELQGIMGYYYALEDKLDKNIALSLKEQYKPVGKGDTTPKNELSVALSLAEKISSLTILYTAGERATGSKDQYGLRRLALGIVRLIIDNQLEIDIVALTMKALKTLPSDMFKESSRHEICEEIIYYIQERLKNYLKDTTLNVELLLPIIELELKNKGQLLINNVISKVKDFDKFINSKEGEICVASYKRAANIIAKSQKDNKIKGKPSKSALENGVEKILFEELNKLQASVKNHKKFTSRLSLLAEISPFIDSFFEQTMINCEDSKIRENRLKLCLFICEIFDSVASFSSL